jgi:putative PEP-CTERM system histidine kinase
MMCLKSGKDTAPATHPGREGKPIFDMTSVVGYGLCTVAYGSLAVLVGLRGDTAPWRWPVMACCLVTSLWGAVVLGWVVEGVPLLVPQIMEVVRDATWLLLLLTLLAGIDIGEPAGQPRLSARWLMTPAVLLVVAMMAAAASPAFASLAWVLTPLVQTIPLIVPVLGLLIVENLFRNSGPSGRWGLKHLCLGLGTLFVFDFIVSANSLLLSHVDPDFLAARGLVAAFTAAPVAISLTRTTSWTRKRDVDINVSRRVVFFTAALTVSGVYLLVMAAAAFYIREIGGLWGSSLQITFIIGGLVVLIAAFGSGTLKSQFNGMVQRHFFTCKYDYREEWLRFVRVLSSGMPLKLSERLARTLAEMIDSPAGALWVHQRRDHAFVLGAAWNYRGVCPSVGRGSALIEFLGRSDAIIEIDDYRAAPQRYPGLLLPDWITSHVQCWVVIPLTFGGELLGFLVLDHARTARRLDWEDRDLLKTAATHAASYLAQELAAEALSDAQRFEDFNRRFAFVVHDIKNVVGQMSLMLENSRRFGDNPDFQKDMTGTVRNSVLRMKALLAQLTEKRRLATDTAISDIDLEMVLADVAGRWLQTRPELRTELPAIGLRASASPENLVSALDLLIDNAFAAAGPRGLVALRLRRRNRQAVIEIEDNGPGMDRDFLSAELFRPLQSTKGDGFGIGAYQTRHLIQEMGGQLEVDSIPDKGTTMRVLLPLAPEMISPTDRAVTADSARRGGEAK